MPRFAPQRRAFLVPVGLTLALLSPLGGATVARSTMVHHGGLLTRFPRRGASITISDDPELGSETRYALRDGSGLERTLVFDTAPDFAPETAIRVWGNETPEGLHVTRAEAITSGVESRRLAAGIGATYPPRSFAFVLVDAGMASISTADDVPWPPRHGADSIRNYYRADSPDPARHRVRRCSAHQLHAREWLQHGAARH